MIVALAALLLTQDMDDHVARLGRMPESRAIGVAAQAWDDCLDRGIRRYEPSGEPADVVATASLWGCQGEFTAMIEATVAFRMATAPDTNEREYRRDQMPTYQLLIRGREWRVTKDVVEMRMARRAD